MDSNSSRMLTVFLALSSFGNLALADAILAPFDQSRIINSDAMISTSEESFSDSHSDSALDFGPFDSAVAATVQVGVQPELAHGTAEQHSQINPTSLIGNGNVHATADAGSPFDMAASAGNDYYVAFSISEPTGYLLTGMLNAAFSPEDGPQPIAGAVLTGPGGELYVNTINSGSSALLSAGFLDPGDYTLEVFAGAAVEASGQNSSADFEFNLTLVPEPATAACLLVAGLLVCRGRR